MNQQQLSMAVTAVAVGLLLAGLTGCDRWNKTTKATAPAPDVYGQQLPASTAASAPIVKDHTGPLDRLTTAAGEITVTEVKSKDDTVTKALSLAGKTIYDQNDYSLDIERAFAYPDQRTVLLLAISEGGTACPSRYRFLTIRADGSTSSTDEFGTCSDVPTVTLADDRITISLPDMQGRGVLLETSPTA